MVDLQVDRDKSALEISDTSQALVCRKTWMSVGGMSDKGILCVTGADQEICDSHCDQGTGCFFSVSHAFFVRLLLSACGLYRIDE